MRLINFFAIFLLVFSHWTNYYFDSKVNKVGRIHPLETLNQSTIVDDVPIQTKVVHDPNVNTIVVQHQY